MQGCTLLIRPQILRTSFIHATQSHVAARYILRNVSSSPASRTTTGIDAGPPRLRAPSTSSHNVALAKLSLAHVSRSYLIMAMSSSNVLLNATMGLLNRVLQTKSAVFDPNRNRALNWVLRRSFYDQFCAGETKSEIERTIGDLHRIGYQGIILEYASEVLEDGDSESSAEAAIKSDEAVDVWKQGMLDTVNLVGEGDFVGLKWSGMGSEALRRLKHNESPSPKMAAAMATLCDAAAARGVKLLPAAEPQNANKAVDDWTLELASKYNKSEPNFALVYNTYQCYLKTTAANLARHMAHAAENNYTLGIKLVRGAYLESEQRDLIWNTKEETDNNYDEIAASLLEKKYGNVLKPATGTSDAFPDINIMLATHNQDSVEKAQTLLENLSPSARELVKVNYAQLQGMADEVGCGLLGADESAKNTGSELNGAKVYKCVTWGRTTECLHYLLRRAAENRDAFTRTVQTRKAMGKELRRRFKSFFGLG